LHPNYIHQYKNSVLIFILISFLGLNVVISQNLSNDINFSKHKYLPGYGLRKMGHPEIFQGNKKKKNILKAGILKWFQLKILQYSA
jgi:hypothetical protein